jgi:hydrogenase maturation protease
MGPADIRFMVIGCGNELAGDDGVGIEVARRLRLQPLGCTVLEFPRAGLEIVDLFDSAHPLVFIDAVMSGAPVGSIHLTKLPSERLEGRSLRSITGHGWGLTEAIGLAQALSRRIPPLWLVGIEIGETTPGKPLSPPVARAADFVCARLDSIVTSFEIAGEAVAPALLLPDDYLIHL